MKLVLKAFWKTRYWLIAFAFAWWNVANVILNAGYFNVTEKVGAVEYHYYYYLGFTSGTAGIVAGVLLGIVYMKSKAYILAENNKTHPLGSGGT
jgi:hypothetical protein